MIMNISTNTRLDAEERANLANVSGNATSFPRPQAHTSQTEQDISQLLTHLGLNSGVESNGEPGAAPLPVGAPLRSILRPVTPPEQPSDALRKDVAVRSIQVRPTPPAGCNYKNEGILPGPVTSRPVHHLRAQSLNRGQRDLCDAHRQVQARSTQRYCHHLYVQMLVQRLQKLQQQRKQRDLCDAHRRVQARATQYCCYHFYLRMLQGQQELQRRRDQRLSGFQSRPYTPPNTPS